MGGKRPFIYISTVYIFTYIHSYIVFLQIKIAEDAIKDARQDDLLHSFGGTAESEKKT